MVKHTLKSNITFENIDGFRVMRIKHHPIMSTGVWNDWYYDKDELADAYKNTDWTDANVRNLFFDHEDTHAKNWIGKVENEGIDGDTIYGDLLIANEEAQKAIAMGTKFGISPKILGRGIDGSVKNFMFKNWSLVVEPACKTTFLNSQFMTFLNSEKAEDSGVLLTPNQFFKMNAGEIMTDEIELKQPEIEVKDESNLEELVEKKVDEVLKKKYPKPDEEKKEEVCSKEEVKKEDVKPEEKLQEESKEELEDIDDEELKEKKTDEKKPVEVLQKKKYPYPDEEKVEEKKLSAMKMEKLFGKLSDMGLLNSDWTDFIKKYKKENPDASFGEIAKAWKKELKNKEIENMVEKKLSEIQKGEKISVRSEAQLPVTEDADVGMMNFLQGAFTNGPQGMSYAWELALQPTINKLGLRTFELASTATTTSSARGTAFTAYPYPLEPILYLRKAIDAAKERMRYLQTASQFVVPEGHKEIVVPKRTKYLADTSWESSTAEYAAGAEIAWTQINTEDGVLFTPTRYNYGVALSNQVIRVNALNQVQYAREELSYKYENSIDSAVRDSLFGTVSSAGAATLGSTEMSNSVNGCQTIFGGDATSASNNLDTGDILTTDMIAKARRLLMSSGGYYWNSNTWTKSAVTKNPWESTPEEPVVLFIAPEQEEALLKDSQFVNAAEYGSNEVLLNGEIGRYLGVKVVSTTKVPAIVSDDEILVQTAQVTEDVSSHLCGMFKSGRVGGIAWSLKPEIRVFDWPDADQIRMKLTMAYKYNPIHSDALVRIIVSDA